MDVFDAILSSVSFEPLGGEPSQIINEPLTFYI
jgi:hypothetical protein